MNREGDSMCKTKRGIYHNLKESEYATSNSEVAFFFSSKFYMGKFMEEHKDFRVEFRVRLERVIDLTYFETDFLADIHFYKSVEKRGFRVTEKGTDISWLNLRQLGFLKMTEKNSIDWQRMLVQKSED